MRHRVSVLLETLDLFDPELSNLPLHGANLATVEMLRRIAVHERIEALEVFLPPAAMVRVDQLSNVAQSVLPLSLRGQGRLSFYPTHAIPDVWADARERILFCLDPEWMARERYLRDRFAIAPTPISCDSHGFGHHRLWNPLARYASAPPVAFDSTVSLSVAARGALQRMFSEFLNGGAAAPCRLDLIPHGINIDLFHPHDQAGKDDARRMLRLPLAKSITLFLGRVTAHGKADLLPLVRAFAAASSDDDLLVIAGEEHPFGYGAKLREFGQSLGLGERIIIHPRVPPAFRSLYFAASDVFVFPGDTIQETLGNTVMEAMATGLPCIISDWDGMRDMVIDGETGYKVPTYWMPGLDQMDAISPATALSLEFLLVAQRVWVDTTQLTKALTALLRSPETRAAMGAAGRARAECEFSWNIALERWVSLWDELAEGAALETEGERAARRSDIDRLGQPTPYDKIFAHYATAVIDDQLNSVRLSAYGHTVASRTSQLELYEETLPLTEARIFDALLDTLSQIGSDWMRIGEALERAAAVSQRPTDKVRFHLSLLLKRDVLQLRRNE
ncbi:MAG: hypothetical protein JWQ02_3670 [Capsulimonas sp.]|nr:hypothetical protein [Capsulimonas sp.]